MTVSNKDRADIRAAFLAGELKVRSVNPASNRAHYATIDEVHQHASADKDLVKITLEGGVTATFTTDHSVFQINSATGLIEEIPAGDVQPEGHIVIVEGEFASKALVASVEAVDSQEFTYDLSVPGPENFVLTNGILAHNSYSIGGISLDLDKSSKYSSMKQNAEENFNKAVEMKARTTKIIKGLRQPRFGVGIRSSFGPHTSRGVLSPRSFVS